MKIKREFYIVSGVRSCTWRIEEGRRDRVRIRVGQDPDIVALTRKAPTLDFRADTCIPLADVTAFTAAIAQILTEAQAQAEEWDKDTGKPWPKGAGEVSEETLQLVDDKPRPF